MSVSMNWDESQRGIVMLTYAEEWTWREAAATFDRALALVRPLSHPVALLFDLSENTYFPPGGLAENVRKAVEKIHQVGNIGVVVVVTPPTSTRDMLIAVAKTYATPSCTYAFVNSLDEASSLIAKHLV
jgi:hypothetical protein